MGAPSSDTSAGLGGSDQAGAAAWVAAALEAALRARAPGVHDSTPTVRRLAVQISRGLDLSDRAQGLVDLCAQLRDVGLVALPDDVVLATGSLSPEDWQVLNRHPIIGAELLGGLSAVAFAAPVVRSHHERWDGEGYPDGLRGDAIPLPSRVIAACDAFVAMASDRPHRRGMGVEAALEHVGRARGSQLDPRVADALVATVGGGDGAGGPVPRVDLRGAVGRVARDVERADGGVGDLRSAIAEFDVVPAFGPAYDRVLAATATGSTTDGSELVAAIESDTGLTVAVLRRAQALASRRPVANVSDAVGALDTSEIAEAVRPLPRAAFPWTTPIEALMHHSRVHAQATMRAVDRIAREVGLEARDDLLVAALLHDIGRLVLGRARPDLVGAADAQTTTPEERVRRERRAVGMDHASVGGLLLTRWGLPDRLASTTAAHHTSEAENEAATFVRLADMVAHHAQGDAVDRSAMLHLAHTCGIDAGTLREVVFDLPHSGGSHRRRAEASPLSKRETAALRLLAEGKTYKVIAYELGVSVSTVRTHLHNTYAKLEVIDRAQAVLRATERAWI